MHSHQSALRRVAASTAGYAPFASPLLTWSLYRQQHTYLTSTRGGNAPYDRSTNRSRSQGRLRRSEQHSCPARFSVGLLHSTRLLLFRDISRNTLADTPSGYIFDPVNRPARMVTYEKLNPETEALREATAFEHDLMQKESVNYPGYTTRRIQQCKAIVLDSNRNERELRDAIAGLEAELNAMLPCVGHEVAQEVSAEQYLLFHLRRWRDKLHARDDPFRVGPGEELGYTITTDDAGNDIVHRSNSSADAMGSSTGLAPVPSKARSPATLMTDDATAPSADSATPSLASLAATMRSSSIVIPELSEEDVQAAQHAPELQPRRVTVCMKDVNHVRYLLGLGYRRLNEMDKAERVTLAVVESDLRNVDALESLLEIYTGLDDPLRVRQLLDYLVSAHRKEWKAEREAKRAAAKQAAEAHTAVKAGEVRGEGVQSERSTDADRTASSDAVRGGGPGAEHRSTASVAVSITEEAPKEENAPLKQQDSTGCVAAASAEGPLSRPSTTRLDSQEEEKEDGKREAALQGKVVETEDADDDDDYDENDGRTPPLVVALSILADLVVDAGMQHCAEHGEGATSRFFLEALSPIVAHLGVEYTPLLLEALFQTITEYHASTRVQHGDAKMEQQEVVFSTVIAFLKTLLARDMDELVVQPERFRFFTLSKLFDALHAVGRNSESYRIAENMMELYRTHSNEYRRRAHAKQIGGTASTLPSSQAGGPRTPLPTPSSATPLDSTTAQSVNATTSQSSTAVEEEKEEDEEQGLLDDQYEVYRTVFLRYMQDRALDSAVVGRRLCLQAMDEFPTSAAPWEVLALLLHREDPKGKLNDAILAAHRALLLEPTNLHVVLTLASFYKAAGQFDEYTRVMDRYKLLYYMLEEGASEEDMLATVQEVLDVEADVAKEAAARRAKEEEEASSGVLQSYHNAKANPLAPGSSGLLRGNDVAARFPVYTEPGQKPVTFIEDAPHEMEQNVDRPEMWSKKPEE